MTPQQFIQKWQGNTLKERASYQLHFIDLCALVGVSTPEPATAETYCFERGATRTGAGQGWADVWKQGYFAFEYKATRRNLGEALKQLMTYALALDNPPLLVVCDTNIIEIHTHFTNAPSEVHTISLEEISEPANLDKLRWLFTDPDKFHPKRTITQITEEAAGTFADLAQSLNVRGHAPQDVAHFLNQCLFCMFAEDAELLPGKLFERLLDKSQTDTDKLTTRLESLFSSMRKGGDFGADDIAWFNGGLFEKVKVLPLEPSEIKMLFHASTLDWSGIEPSIFGTLFERGLDPQKRSQLGAHYTDQQSILRIINPVIVEPLTKEWDVIKLKLSELHPKFALIGKRKDAPNEAMKEGYKLFLGYLEQIRNFRVLDPACGSGNFLYLALRALKDLEHRANLDAEVLGLHREISIECSPANVLGIELNSYAAELARVTVWIGEIQWMLKNGYPIRKNPILQPLDHIENRDAVLNANGSEAQWPAVDAIIGNPPFLGDKKMRAELGNEYTEALRKCYADRVPGGADLVVYWFEKARAQIEAGKCRRSGLVATQSIRKGSNQKVLARICNTTKIFNAWSDEEWINEGAAVRVSLVCFGNVERMQLDGQTVEAIHADLTAGNNLTQANALEENAGVAFQGPVKVGSFDIPGEIARQWLKQPNPNGRPNSDVVRPWANGQDVTGRPSDTWIIDFGADRTEQEAALYETPFVQVLREVKPQRDAQNDAGRKAKWWLHGRTGTDFRAAVAPLKRYIATPRVAKHRMFVWLDVSVLPDSRLYAIARDDDVTFGVLSSRVHEVWSLANASMHGVGNDPTYNAKSCFETFPFPEWLMPNLTPADCTNAVTTEIATAAQELNKLRDNWLNPIEWVDWLRTPAEEKADYPLRPVPKIGHEDELKKRTLTNLYNARPAWLDNAHKTLDAAVAKAYNWNDYTPEMTDEEILRRLLVLNQTRFINIA
ncbi:MAG: class I SAM-dependent DNA methyltransferase [Gallionella sp.]|nr:class I SAM-dependent DNA methyltransferase [Gallionella sp.]